MRKKCDLGLCKFVGYFHVFPSKLLATLQGACSAQKRPAKDAPTIADNCCLKIRNNDDRDFPPKMTFIRTLIFQEFGMCSKSLGTN